MDRYTIQVTKLTIKILTNYHVALTTTTTMCSEANIYGRLPATEHCVRYMEKGGWVSHNVGEEGPVIKLHSGGYLVFNRDLIVETKRKLVLERYEIESFHAQKYIARAEALQNKLIELGD